MKKERRQRAAVKRGMLCALALAFLFCTGCGGSRGSDTANSDTRSLNGREIYARIETFENCCYALDFNGILDCIDPADTALVKVALETLELATGTDSDEFLDGASELIFEAIEDALEGDEDWPDLDGETVVSDCLKTISIEADEVTISRRRSDIAVVNCTVTIQIGDEEVTSRVELDMVKSDGEWYIDIG